MTSTIVIQAKYDFDAKVWWVEHSSLLGVHAEGETLKDLCDKLPAIVSDLIEANGILKDANLPKTF
jgi:predicted RNase H-like HicB family nuclease